MSTPSTERIESEIQRTRVEIDHTLEAIEERLSPRRLMTEAVDYMRAGPGEFASNLGQAIKNNPLPVALVGLGIGWLAVSGPRGRLSDHQPHYGSRQGLGGNGAEAVSSLGEKMAGSIGEKVAGAKGAATGAKDRLQQAGQSITDTAGQARHQAERLKGGFSHMLEDQPLMLGMIGMAIGAAIGAAMPSTRREDELVGDARDSLVDKAIEKGREQADKAERAVERAAEAAKREAHQQEKGGEKTDDLATKAGRVAAAAEESAKDEARRQNLGSIGRTGSGSASGE